MKYSKGDTGLYRKKKVAIVKVNNKTYGIVTIDEDGNHISEMRRAKKDSFERTFKLENDSEPKKKMAMGGELDHYEIYQKLSDLGIPSETGDRVLAANHIEEVYGVSPSSLVKSMSDDTVYRAIRSVEGDYELDLDSIPMGTGERVEAMEELIEREGFGYDELFRAMSDDDVYLAIYQVLRDLDLLDSEEDEEEEEEYEDGGELENEPTKSEVVLRKTILNKDGDKVSYVIREEKMPSSVTVMDNEKDFRTDTIYIVNSLNEDNTETYLSSGYTIDEAEEKLEDIIDQNTIIEDEVVNISESDSVVFAEDNNGFYKVLSTHITESGAKRKHKNSLHLLEKGFVSVGYMDRGSWDNIYDKISYKEGGQVDLTPQSVEVIFADPAYNYTTSVSPFLSEEQVKAYFVGKSFNVAPYPREQFEEVVDAKLITKKPQEDTADKDKMEKGGSIKEEPYFTGNLSYLNW